MTFGLLRMDGSARMTLLAGRQAVIGRDATNAIVIDDPMVSKFHARLIFNGARAYLQDLGSRNGVFVNGVRAFSTALRHLDIIRVGHTEFRYFQTVDDDLSDLTLASGSKAI